MMTGEISTFLPEKGYGFIKGDDGKDYFFHQNEFRQADQKKNLCEGAFVQFDQQATPKGYKARACTLIDPAAITNYITPDEFIASKSSRVSGWDVIEAGDWILHGRASSPDEARQDVIEKAQRIGANAVLDLQYYKETASEPGTGSGTYYYTIHRFRARPVILAKRHARGTHTPEELKGINEAARQLKEKLKFRSDLSEGKKGIIWLAVLFGSIYAFSRQPLWIFLLIFIGVVLARSSNYDFWLEESPAEKSIKARG